MNSTHWPLFGFGCLAFLLICTVIAVACFLIFRSGEKGKTKLGAPAGCLIGCALCFMALLAASGVLLVLTFHAKQELVRHGPFKRFEFELEPRAAEQPGESAQPGEPAQPAEPGAEPAARHARLTIEMAGDQGWADLSADITSWLREHVSGEIGVRIESRTTPAGPRTALVFEVDVAESELADLRRDLREVLPTLRLPRHIEAELKDD